MKGIQVAVLLICLTLYTPATGFILQETTFCTFGDTEGGNVTFYYMLSFNRLPVVEYDKTDNMFVPMIRDAVPISTLFNQHPEMMKEIQQEEQKCKEQVKKFWGGTTERSVQPSMMVYHPESQHDTDTQMLVCHVWGFYPKNIKVAWVKNENTVLVNYTEANAVGDWTYQLMALLNLRDSKPGDYYECVVHHSSLKEIMSQKWEPGLTSTQIMKISISTAVFALGIFSLSTGCICWMLAKRGGYIPITEYNRGT